MLLPMIQSQDQSLSLVQTKYRSILNPFLSNPLNNKTIIFDIPISVGKNVINHGLGHMQTGWTLIDVNSSMTLYRSAPFNSSTLTLTASATGTISLEVF